MQSDFKKPPLLEALVLPPLEASDLPLLNSLHRQANLINDTIVFTSL
jgi:hypothetical protein